MNRTFMYGIAIFFAVLGLAVMDSGNEANAGHRRHGCAGISDCCGAGHHHRAARCHGARRHRCHGGLFGRMRNRGCGGFRHHQRGNDCCGQVADCCPAPVEPCCQPAPSCCGQVIEPACGAPGYSEGYQQGPPPAPAVPGPPPGAESAPEAPQVPPAPEAGDSAATQRNNSVVFRGVVFRR